MQNHKVIDVLRSFSPKTAKKFLLYIQSSFTGRALKAIKLGAYLMTFYPNFDQEILTEEAAFKTLELNKAYSKQELVRYLSKLLALIEEFIAIDSLENVPYRQGFLVAEFYYETKNDSNFNRSIKQNNKLLSSSQTDSTNYFYTYLNNKLAHNYARQQRSIKQANTFLDTAVPALDNYYILQLIQSAIAYFYNQKKKPDATIFPLLAPVIEHLEGNKNTISSLVLLWFLAYKLTLDPDDKPLYQELKQTLLLHIKRISSIDAHNIGVVLNNTAIRQLRGNRKWYIKERFDLYQIEIQESWIIAKGIINYVAFNNIIVIALAYGKIDFSEAFLKDYKRYLLPEAYDDIVSYNEARIAFAKADFSTSLFRVQQVGYLDQAVAIGVKRLQAMCHLELENLEQLIHTMNSLKMYLYRLDESKASLKNTNIQFLKVLGLLSKQVNGVLDKKSKTTIQEILDERQLMPEMEWIEEKLSQGVEA
ncbi:MAG: hypothetical protein AB8F95_13680 [Bacteroidia bacterium]